MNTVNIAGSCNLQAFLKFTNFYQKFIHSFLDIAQLLFDLIRDT